MNKSTEPNILRSTRSIGIAMLQDPVSKETFAAKVFALNDVWWFLVEEDVRLRKLFEKRLENQPINVISLKTLEKPQYPCAITYIHNASSTPDRVIFKLTVAQDNFKWLQKVAIEKDSWKINKHFHGR